MDRTLAEEILHIAEQDMSENGGISFDTVKKMQNAVDGTGKDYVTYLYPDGHIIKFNSGLWKRHFIEGVLSVSSENKTIIKENSAIVEIENNIVKNDTMEKLNDEIKDKTKNIQAITIVSNILHTLSEHMKDMSEATENINNSVQELTEWVYGLSNERDSL